jgi:hypothetical protein
MKTFSLTCAVVGLALIGCERPVSKELPPTTISALPSLDQLPVSMKVMQRSTTPIPGSDDELLLTIDDITRGQVMVTILRTGQKSLLGPISMEEGDTTVFSLGESAYSLELSSLENDLVGDDFAEFTISLAKSESLTEEQKIERLIAKVESATGAVFVRNGVEHSPIDAAKHLRQKLEAAAGRIETASQFIDVIASKSSISGEDYKIWYSDGRTETAATFLRDELAKLERDNSVN